MVISRYVIAAALVLAGLLFIGQGLGFVGGSVMSGQPIYAVLGLVLVVVGAALAWNTRRKPTR
jgi:hypothetical protein